MNRYENKKVAILRGYPRLIDGESTSVEEMYYWGQKNNVEIETFYLHKPWKRKKPEYSDGYNHSYQIFSRETIDDVLKDINDNYDLVILINPAKPHSGLTKEDVYAFYNFYKKIDVVKVQMQHTSFVKAIDETPFCWGYINASDAVYNHSEESWYMTALVKQLPSKKTRAYPMHLWTDVEKYKDYYKNKNRLKNITYIGRFVAYKGVLRFMNISEAIVEKSGLKPVIYGMDTSISCRSFLLTHKNCKNYVQKNPNTLEFNTNPIVDTYKRIEREEVMKRFNESLFAATLFKFQSDRQKSFYGDRLEYTMQEAIMAGSILVVDETWAKECKTIDGQRYIDIPNFAIPMSEKYPGDAIVKMKEVAEDEELQQLYRDTAFEVLRKEYDSNIVLPKLFNELFSISKDLGKFPNDYELVKYLTQSDEKAKRFIEVFDEGEILPMSPRAMSENKISFYGGKRGKKIEELI